MENYPYADALQTGLQHMLSTPDVHIDVDGRAGDQVRGTYLNRLELKLEAAAKTPYDWIIVMGGTNDLGWGQQPHDIYENLSKWFPKCYAPRIVCKARVCYFGLRTLTIPQQ